MSIESALSKQKELAQWINDHFCLQYSVDRKGQLALGCFDLAIEHHSGICTLCEDGLYGTMYALLRVEFEAYGKGLWLRHVADEQQIGNYESDDLNIGFGTLLKLVEGRIGLSSGPLTALRSKHWDIFCSFTHTGPQALVRRINSTHTGLVNYPESEVVSALSLAGSFAMLSATELASLSGDEKLVLQVFEKAREYARK